MNAYIEIESLRSLINQRHDERYGECLRMLKRNLSLNFSFSKAEALADPVIQNWVKELTVGSIAPKPNWDSTYPDPLNELSLDGITIDKLCAVYLLDDTTPQSLAKAMLVSCFGHELDTLSKLFVRTDMQEFDDQLAPSSIGSWKKLDIYCAPCTDILIADRYILSDKRLLSRNLYSIINILTNKTKGKRINIVIAVERNSINVDIDLENVSETIKSNVEENVGVKPNVTFLLCAQHGGEHLFHDRLILTNYRAITSGDSFNYFNPDGKVRTGGFGITITSLAKKYSYVQEQVINTYCGKLQNEVRYAMIKGDKMSNFLLFR